MKKKCLFYGLFFCLCIFLPAQSYAVSPGSSIHLNAKENISLRWTYNVDGKGNDGGVPSAKINAIHFVWSHVF
jgi:hypothetical protein